MNVRERRLRRKMNEIMRTIEIMKRRQDIREKIFELRQVFEELIYISIIFHKNRNGKQLRKRNIKTKRKQNEMADFI